MTGKDDLHEVSASAEEQEEARRLAEALNGRTSAWPDSEPIVVARLFQALAAEDLEDDLARTRLRRDLVTAVRRPRRRLHSELAAAAALAVLALLAAYFILSPGRPSERLLRERERMAKKALSSVTSVAGPIGSTEVRSTLTYNRQWQLRASSVLESARYERLAEAASTSSSQSTVRNVSNSGGDS